MRALRGGLAAVAGWAVVGCSTPGPCTGSDCDTQGELPEADPVTVRFATFNVSMFGNREGEIAEAMARGTWEKAAQAAEILQIVRPDVLLINEFDYDPTGASPADFHDTFLAVGHNGLDPLDYPYVYTAPVNTGVHSGFDLDGNGRVDDSPGDPTYGNDAFGYGLYPGQYGMVVYSRYPIDAPAVRTFQTFLWKDLPDTQLPFDFYGDASAALRLSSKSHWDVPVAVPFEDGSSRAVHLLASHPTPPAFDGPEDRNGKRNQDEIRFWHDYVEGGADSYHVDDAGQRGGLDGALFVIAGDLNSDPNDGDTAGGAISALLASESVLASPVPSSVGGAEQAGLQGGANAEHTGDPAHDTIDSRDSGDGAIGNLRLDYVIPSAGLSVEGAGVFWPASDDPSFGLVGTFPFPVSDHRVVWVDVAVPPRR